MADFPVNLEPFLSPEFENEHGGKNRVARTFINLSGKPIYTHEQFTISVDVAGVLQPGDNREFLQQIKHYFINEVNHKVISSCLHPLGVGLLELETSMHQDSLLAGNIHEIDGVQIIIMRHDYGRNHRSSPYTRYGWIIMLGYLLD
jgi:hypothetical protein